MYKKPKKSEESKNSLAVQTLQNPLADPYKEMYALKDTIPKGQGFFIELLLEAGKHKLIKLRSSLSGFEWNGEWAKGNPNWDEPVV